jgi:uncharacterized protein (TIGR03118 family)
MQRPSSRQRWLALITLAAATSLLPACGGGGDGEMAASANDSDNADSNTMGLVRALLGAAEADVNALYLPPTPASTPDAALSASRPATDGDDDSWFGWYPGVQQTNLAANKPGYGTRIVEPGLQNAWGVAIRAASPVGHFWVGAAGSGRSIQYVGDVGGAPLFQDALRAVSTGGPVSGVAFNPGRSFVITQAHINGPITAPARFFFANLSGTISAWTERARPEGGFDHPRNAQVVVNRSAQGSAFTGVTVNPSAARIFAADFGADAELRVFDPDFKEHPPLPNVFRPDGQKVPGGFEAFNVQTLGQRVFVTYGRQVSSDLRTPPPPDGRLVEFDDQGRVMARWRGRGLLNRPWGVAEAPKDFGLYSGCLLVGNSGDGTVVAFHPKLKVALDYMRDTDGERVIIDGLRGLQFGNGASLGEANHLYFAAAPNREADGLFGKLQANPLLQRRGAGPSLCR